MSKKDDDLDFSDHIVKPYRTTYHGDLVYEFFRSNVPSDLHDDTEPDYQEQQDDYAIYQAREQAPDWCIPADWRVVRWDGNDAIVLRRHRMDEKELKEHRVKIR